MLATFQMPPEAAGEVTNPQSGLVVETFDDMLDERDLAFPGPGFNDQTAIVLPNHAFLDSATVNMSFGVFPGSRSAPWDPSMDVGDDGTVDWAFDSDRGGPVGLQDRFADGELEQEMEFMSEGFRDFFIRLPRDATITEAYVDVEGLPIPHWVKQYTLTPRTDSPGEYGPKMAELNGEMWTIWQSSDPNITTDGDADVVVRMFDGERWHRIIELSEVGDTDEDDIPQLIAFKDKLYAIWARGDGKSTASGHTELVYRAYDGTSWSPEQRFSGPKADGLNTYERCVVFKDRLYVFWKTTDPSYSEHAYNGWDLDIVYRSFDGESWSSIIEITDADNDYEDWLRHLGHLGPPGHRDPLPQQRGRGLPRLRRLQLGLPTAPIALLRQEHRPGRGAGRPSPPVRLEEQGDRRGGAVRHLDEGSDHPLAGVRGRVPHRVQTLHRR
jgi:hypothetical protein